MNITLGAPEELFDSLQSFLQTERIDLEVVSSDDCAVRVAQSDEPSQSDMNILQASGWIKCPTALALASKLGIRTQEMGRILNHLEIKVRDCGLGCF